MSALHNLNFTNNFKKVVSYLDDENNHFSLFVLINPLDSLFINFIRSLFYGIKNIHVVNFTNDEKYYVILKNDDFGTIENKKIVYKNLNETLQKENNQLFIS